MYTPHPHSLRGALHCFLLWGILSAVRRINAKNAKIQKEEFVGTSFEMKDVVETA